MKFIFFATSVFIFYCIKHNLQSPIGASQFSEAVMKKELLAVTCLLSTQDIFAYEFWGVGAGKSYMQVDSGRSNELTKNSDLSPEIRAGFINENLRLYGSFIAHRSFYKDNDSKTKEELFYGQFVTSLDFFFPSHKQVKLFAGPHLGLNTASVKIDYEDSYKKHDAASGVVIGAQLGAIFVINTNFSIETSYSQSFTTIGSNLKYRINGEIVKSDIDIERIDRLYLTVNYTL